MTTTIRAAIELRDGGDSSPGRLVGVLMRYGAPGERGREEFAPGALRWPANGIRIDLGHGSAPIAGRSAQPPIMRAVPVVSDDGAEVRIDAPLPDTHAARDLATLMRMDPPAYSGLSVEFHAVRSGYAGGRRVVQDALLKGAGLVDTPSYSDTSVEVRSGCAPERRRVWL
ncbi:MAG: hypothetical protein OXH75_18885 [Acidobacteria bacterium]|nr:hypothetical protein [Acidobacteriota bacterium]